MYDLTIAAPGDWQGLQQRGLRAIVDPFIYRLGQIFLEGGQATEEIRWKAVERDLGALVSFFDLIVLNDQLPAFNYTDTFDIGLDFDQSLGRLVNREDTTLVSVDVKNEPYMIAKTAAVQQLRLRLADGPLVPADTATDILASLDAVEYKWEPKLLGLEENLRGDDAVKLARFLGGVLVFAGYAQQTGAPHVLAPRRSRLVAAAGIQADRANQEAQVYEKVRERLRNADGWREEDLPWTPSFLPFLLGQIKPGDGPDILLKRAKDLRSYPSVQRYRGLREAFLSEDAGVSAAARLELVPVADEIARELRSNRQELECTGHIFVEVLPKAFGRILGPVAGAGAGAVAGAAKGTVVGTVLAGPFGTVVGGIAGGIAGLVGEEALKPIHRTLWGWVLDGLPFLSARKLLTRSVKAEHELRGELGSKLRAIWDRGKAMPIP